MYYLEGVGPSGCLCVWVQEAQPLIEVTLPGGRKIVRRAPFEGDIVTTVAQQVSRLPAASDGYLLLLTAICCF